MTQNLDTSRRPLPGAESVWQIWVAQRQEVTELTKRLLPDLACR